MTTGYQLVNQMIVLVQSSVRLRNDKITFLNSRQIMYLVSDLTIDYFPMWTFQKAEIIRTRINRQRINQTDIRTFWRFNRTNPAIMRMMNVTHFKPSAL